VTISIKSEFVEERKEEAEPVSAGKPRKSRKDRQAEKMKTGLG